MQMLCFVLQKQSSAKISELKPPPDCCLLSGQKPGSAIQGLFRVFISFCICINVSLYQLSITTVVSFLEYLVSNGTSVHMVSNYFSALKAMAVVYNLQFQIFYHPQVKYFIKSLKINRPLTVCTKNIMDIKALSQLIESCTGFTNAITFKAIFNCIFWLF